MLHKDCNKMKVPGYLKSFPHESQRTQAGVKSYPQFVTPNGVNRSIFSSTFWHVGLNSRGAKLDDISHKHDHQQILYCFVYIVLRGLF